MPELHDLLERRASGYRPPPDLFDRVLERRRRRERNRRLGTTVVALVLATAAIGGLVRGFMSGSGRRPADQTPTGFVGAWVSKNYNDYVVADNSYAQTMTIRAGEDGVLHITVRDDSSSACSDTPTTMTGIGRLEDPTTLVVPSPVLACVDGSDPTGDGPSGLEASSSYTLVRDLATDRLYDNRGVVWNRGTRLEKWAAESTLSGVDGPGTFAILHGEITFRATEPWNDHIEAYIDPRLFFLIGPGDKGATGGDPAAHMTIFVNPLPPETPCDSLRVPPSAEELVQGIRSNPDLEATMPVTERVGGIDALRMDVAAASGASVGPCSHSGVDVVSVPGRPWGGVELGQLGRLYVLDIPVGSARTLAILITAPEAALFERAVDAAAPVLESFEFHTR